MSEGHYIIRCAGCLWQDEKRTFIFITLKTVISTFNLSGVNARGEVLWISSFRAEVYVANKGGDRS